VITKFVERYMAGKEALRARFTEQFPIAYSEIVRAVVDLVGGDEMDPERIHEINDGDYQGTLVYVIGDRGYKPSKYYYVRVAYGSCSGCDTLKDLQGYSGKPDNVEGALTLALHIVQQLKAMDPEYD
jgi:hypothetical protein